MLTRPKIDTIQVGDVIVADYSGYTWRVQVTHVHGAYVCGDALEPCQAPFYTFPVGENLRVYYSNIVLVEEVYDGERA